MKICILRGVPSSLRQDGWWLDPFTPGGSPPDKPHAAQNPNRYALHALLLAGLMAVSQLPGLSDVPPAPDIAPNVVACGSTGDLGFYVTQDLRSFGADT